MYGIGSTAGSLTAAFYLDTLQTTRYFYFICSAIGFATFINGILLSMEIEAGGEHIAKMAFCDRAKKNGREIWQGLKIRELHREILYICLMGALIPNVNTYLYYYERE